VQLNGRDFSGGGAPRFGYDIGIHTNVSYVYAENTGLETIAAAFHLAEIPQGTAALALEGLANDIGTPCPIEIEVNGWTLFEGIPPYWRDRWDWWRFPIPAGALRTGTNELRVKNLSPEGEPGNPPWFMVRSALIGDANDLPSPAEFEPSCEISHRDAQRQRSLAKTGPLTGPGEPSGTGDDASSRFRIRGMKGMLWAPETYIEEIPFLARYRFNLLMHCYTSMWDLETDGANRWFREIPEEKMDTMRRVVEKCAENGIAFCFSINPALNSPRPFRTRNGGDFEILWDRFQAFQDLGVRWFSVAFDDISTGVDAPGHAECANRLLERLRERDPEARLILCPTVYHNKALKAEWAREYLRVLGRKLHPDIEIFWTGPGVCSWRMTSEDAAEFTSLIGRKPFVWDNYPVNDGAPILHLAPLQGRAPGLARHVSGYLFNPMYQHEINRLPAITIADYLWDPENYDPWQSIAEAVDELGDSDEEREVLRELVGLHCGFPTEFADHSGFGSIEGKLVWCRRQEDPEEAQRELKARLFEVRRRFNAAFPDRFRDVGRILGIESEGWGGE